LSLIVAVSADFVVAERAVAAAQHYQQGAAPRRVRAVPGARAETHEVAGAVTAAVTVDKFSIHHQKFLESGMFVRRGSGAGVHAQQKALELVI
jgi:hypothetical protein